MSEDVVVFTSQWFVQKVGDSIIPIILSTSISLFANKWFVQRSQKKRLHSKNINDESFKPWNRRINELCSIGGHTPVVEYSHEGKRVVPIELKKLDLISHHTYLESHMKTGYPQVWELWDQLRMKSLGYFQAIADAHEVIREQIMEDCGNLDLLEHYHQQGRKTPQETIQPYNIAVKIYTEIDNRLEGMDDWIIGKPTKNYSTNAEGRTLVQLNFAGGGYMLDDFDEEIVDYGIELILRYVEKGEYIKEITKIRKMFDDIVDVRDTLQENLEDMTSKIDLVNDVRGRCEAC